MGTPFPWSAKDVGWSPRSIKPSLKLICSFPGFEGNKDNDKRPTAHPLKHLPAAGGSTLGISPLFPFHSHNTPDRGTVLRRECVTFLGSILPRANKILKRIYFTAISPVRKRACVCLLTTSVQHCSGASGQDNKPRKTNGRHDD